MSPVELFIELHSSVRSFFPGQTIAGRVIASFREPKEFKSISILFEGQARVHWTETRTVQVRSGNGNHTSSRTETVHYRAEENYFTCRILLLGNDSGSMTLPSGTTYYPFQFTLPNNLPSSFTSRDGMVHYLMEARLKRSWYKSDLTNIIPFTVNSIVDLNTEFGANLPVELYKEKFAGCCCCKSGPIAFNVKMTRQGFVPGEVIPMHIDLTNSSKRKINKTRMTLVQIVTCHARGKSRQSSKVISEVHGPGVDRGETEAWIGNLMRVAALPPSKLGGCRIIDVDYVLEIVMEISNAINLKDKIPIKIGTIPFRTTFIDFMPSAPVDNALPSGPFFGGPDMLPKNPPAYSEAAGFVKPFPEPGPSSGINMNSGWVQFPSAPVFDMYPDLPPPTYAEAMQTDNFAGDFSTNDQKGGTQEANNAAGDSTLNSDRNDPQNSSAPPVDFSSGFNFVPNYLVYNYHDSNANGVQNFQGS